MFQRCEDPGNHRSLCIIRKGVLFLVIYFAIEIKYNRKIFRNLITLAHCSKCMDNVPVFLAICLQVLLIKLDRH